ncbi:MAG: hypothetical protein SGBAC_003382 [Bacillariaceae sp.]
MNINTSLRSKQTQCLVQKSLRAISSTAKAESTLPKGGGQASFMSWNGNNQTASSITRKVSGASMGGGDDEFPMKLAHFIQRRNRHHAQKSKTQKLQEKWAKLASLTMDPSIGDMAKTVVSAAAELPQTLTEAMSDPRPCMIASIDDPFTIVNVNQAWCQAYGYCKDAVLNQNMIKLLGNSQALEDSVLEQLLKDDNDDDELSLSLSASATHYTRDGTPVHDPLRVGTLSIGADVSDRYIVCVTEMEVASSNTKNRMITSLEDPQMWGGQMGLV